MWIIADRVVETTTTTGTGDITTAGAVAGFQAFDDVCEVEDTFPYLIEAIDVNGTPTGQWEVGMGTYGATNILERTTVVASSDGISAVDFSAGTKRVQLSLIAAQVIDFLTASGNLAGLADVEAAQVNLKIVTLADQAAYDALDPPDPDTYYFIPAEG